MLAGGPRREWKYLYTTGKVRTGAAAGVYTKTGGTGSCSSGVSVNGRVKSFIQPQVNFTSCPDVGEVAA